MTVNYVNTLNAIPSYLDKMYAQLIQDYRQSPPALSGVSPQTLCVLEVNFNAIAYNYLRLKEQFTGSVCAAVVKSDAYGVGAVGVAQKLYAVGCRHFFVANVDEGVELRSCIPHDVDIFIFSGVLPNTEDILVRHNLIPVLINRDGLLRWQQFSHQVGRQLPAVIHVDTGMNRTGFALCDLQRIAADSGALDGLDVKMLMSHLACSPSPDHNLNYSQLGCFREGCRLFPGVPASLVNSEGIFLPQEFHFDCARPGGGLYGFNSSNVDMVPALRFWARVIHIHAVQKGDSVGYGGSYRFQRNGRVAVLAAGYYHGWIRSLSNHTEVYIAGRKARVVGPISMDLCTVDVTDIPENALSAHSWVELAGQHVPLRQLAKNGGSITTELLTLITRTRNRIYVGAAEKK
ncbi:MAG: alanine racemase [Alphaproteobacteria bacterium]|nr:MAG: alanine racemase [Alphaproteobacteria bacterium]